jgi:thioredoxin reductase (NADPH)
MANQAEANELYEVAIIGAGMAGLTAAIFCLRFRLKAVIVARQSGGVITESSIVENWPGIKSIPGVSLMESVHEQASELGGDFVFDEVTEIKGEFPSFIINTAGGKAVRSRAIILASGSERRKLGVPGEQEFAGRGVSYCATCDAFFFRGKRVAVVGGSDGAAVAAELLAKFADKVYVLYRREQLRAEPIRVERLQANPRVEIRTRAVVEKIEGKDTVTALLLEGGEKLPVDGVFVEIGFLPATKLPLQLGVALDESGFIQVDEGCRTNVSGVYAAGDVTTGSNRMRQLVTAAAEGAIAAESLYEDLKSRPLEF